MKISPLIVLSLTFLFSCQTKKPVATLDQTITIDLTESVESQAPAEEWIEDIQFIPLETNPKCFISTTNKYNLNQDHIVVASDETIHLFNRDGKHLKSFKRQGKGPGEYGMIYNIDLVPDRDEIMVADPMLQKILCYDFSGNPACDIHPTFRPANVAPVKGGFFACYLGRQDRSRESSPGYYQVVFLNREGQITSKYLPFKYSMRSASAIDFSHSGETGTYFFNPDYCFDIFQAGPGDQFPVKYRFSFGDYGVDTSLLSNAKIMSAAEPDQVLQAKRTNLRYLTITSNTISFMGDLIRGEPRMGTRQINRKSGHIRFREFDGRGIFGRYAGIPIELNPQSTGDYFVFSKDAVDLMEILKKLTPEQKKVLSKFKGFERLAKLKEDDNPVLVLYKVKDF